MSDVPKVGVWRAVGGLLRYPVHELLWPEGLPAVVLGVGGTAAIVQTTSISDRVGAIDDLVQVSIGLLAIVFTALAIIVALPASRYLRAMQKDSADSDDMRRFLDPFLIAVGTQFVLLLSLVGYKVVATSIGRTTEHVVFYALGFLFTYGVLDVVGLARSLVRHGIMRARDSVTDHDEHERKIASLAERR